MAKDYYFILGVSPTATFDQIKGAYRQLVKDLHPDHHGEDPSAFLDVQEAYSILGDPRRRRDYDLRLQADTAKRGWFPRGPEPLRPPPSSPEPLRSSERPVDLGEASLKRSFRSFMKDKSLSVGPKVQIDERVHRHS